VRQKTHNCTILHCIAFWKGGTSVGTPRLAEMELQRQGRNQEKGQRRQQGQPVRGL